MPLPGLASGPPSGVGKEGEAARPRDRPTRRWHGRTRERPAARRARADGGGEPQPSPGAWPTSGCPTSTSRGAWAATSPTSAASRGRSRSRSCRRSRGRRSRSTCSPRTTCPSYHREIDRAFGRRQRLGHLGQPVDRRGGSARVLHPRLPAGHPRRRPRRARARADGDDGDRLRRRGQAAAQRLRVRVLPGARDPRLAPQHRPLHRGADRREAARPGSPRTRTCT